MDNNYFNSNNPGASNPSGTPQPSPIPPHPDPPILTPTHFDDQPQQPPLDANGQPIMPGPTPEERAESAVKQSHASLGFTIAMSGLAIAGVAFGIWGIVSSIMANSQFNDLQRQVKTLNSNIQQLTTQLVEQADSAQVENTDQSTTSE